MVINGIGITAKFIRPVKGFPFDPNNQDWHNEFAITLRRNGVTRRFRWYGPDCRQQKTALSRDDLRQVLIEAANDALDYHELTLEEYAANTETERNLALRAYKDCGQRLSQFADLGLGPDELRRLVS